MRGSIYMEIHESGEMYLETILILHKQNDTVRSIDIARKLDFSKPSVSRAMSILKDADYITVEHGGLIEFTASGRALAEKTYERHVILTKYLKSIGISDKIAEADACRIEHILSKETFDKIKEIVASL